MYVKYKYPNAALEMLKERHGECNKCGFKVTDSELKKLMQGKVI